MSANRERRERPALLSGLTLAPPLTRTTHVSPALRGYVVAALVGGIVAVGTLLLILLLRTP